MAVRRIFCVTLLALGLSSAVEAQQNAPDAGSKEADSPIPPLQPGSARPVGRARSGQDAGAGQYVSLTVPKGTSLQVALEQEVRVQRVGQSVEAQVNEPVYAFDRLVVAVGLKVRGEVTKIEPVSRGKRTLAGLDGDFTPARAIEIRFTDLALADGKHIPLRANVTPGSGQVLRLVSAPDKQTKKTVKDEASEKAKEAKHQAKEQWDNAMKQLKTAGRTHRLKRYAEGQLPVHRQYIPAGTMYFVELEDPLDFGSEPLRERTAATVGGAVPEGSVVHARLLTPLSSATAQKGQNVEAVLTRPLFNGERLLLPQGSRLLGAVGQVQPARHLKKNGQLRIAFHQIVLPDGVAQKVQAALVGVQAGKDGKVRLDSEGGAEATNARSRYLTTTVSLGLAAVAARGDPDAAGGDRAGNTSSRTAGGVGGFKLVGAVLGAAVRSRVFGYTLGAYGAGMSVYRNFISRGHEVVFPKNTAMEIGIGTRAAADAPTTSAPSSSSGTGP
jgi:type IV secretory pathway VirB10-like protein